MPRPDTVTTTIDPAAYWAMWNAYITGQDPDGAARRAGYDPASGEPPPISTRDFVRSLMPRLDEPEEVDIDSLLTLIGELRNTMTVLQTKLTSENIDFSSQERTAARLEADRQMEIARQKAREAQEAAEKAKVGMWLQAVFGMIGAILGVLAAVGTGGWMVAAAVGGVIAAVKGMVETSLSTAGVTATDAMGNKIQLGNLFAAMVQAGQAEMVASGAILRQDQNGNVIDKNGKVLSADELAQIKEKNPGVMIRTEKQLADEVMGTAIFLELVVVLATIACGVKGMHKLYQEGKKAADGVADGVGEAAKKSLKDTSTRFQQGAEYAAGAAAVGSGTSGVVTGTYNGIGAVARVEQYRADSESHFYDKKTKLFQADLERLQQLVQGMAEALEECYDTLTEAISQYGHTQIAVTNTLAATIVY
jgi:uncharacterized protein YsxB (DUF464 family)